MVIAWYKLFPRACEACSPLDVQELSHWDGTDFVTVATRALPGPVITLNRLRVALQQGDRLTAASLVSDPALLDRLAPLLLPASDNYREYADASAISAIEARNWGGW